MPIVVQHDPPVGVMGLGAYGSASALAGEKQALRDRDRADTYRRWWADRALQQQNLQAQRADQMRSEQMRARESAANRQMQAVALQQRADLADQTNQTNQRYLEQSDQQRIAAGLESGDMAYTLPQKRQLSQLEDQRARIGIDPRYSPDQRDDLYRQIDDQIRGIRPRPVPGDEKPPTLRGPNGEGQFGMGDWFSDPGFGLWSVEQDANGMKWRQHTKPAEMPEEMEREREFKRWEIEQKQQAAAAQKVEARQQAMDDAEADRQRKEADRQRKEAEALYQEDRAEAIAERTRIRDNYRTMENDRRKEVAAIAKSTWDANNKAVQAIVDGATTKPYKDSITEAEGMVPPLPPRAPLPNIPSRSVGQSTSPGPSALVQSNPPGFRSGIPGYEGDYEKVDGEHVRGEDGQLYRVHIVENEVILEAVGE